MQTQKLNENANFNETGDVEMALTVRKENTQPQTELKDKANEAEQAQATNETVEKHTQDPEPQTETQAKADDQPAGDTSSEALTGELVDDPAANNEPEGSADEPEAAAQASGDVEEQREPEQRQQENRTTATGVRVSENTSVALPTATKGAAHNVFKSMIAKLAESGQEGLEFGFGVFPMLSLDKGDWKLGDEDLKDSAFKGVALSSSPKFAYRTTNVSDKDSEVIFADSDREHTDPNSAVSAKLTEWKQKFPDSGWEVKKYQNVYFYLTDFPDKPEMVGQIVVLSVAPTSVKNYTNACIMASGKGYDMHECVTEVKVGDKINGDYSYYPWAFKVVGSCKKLGVEVKFGTERDEDF